MRPKGCDLRGSRRDVLLPSVYFVALVGVALGLTEAVSWNKVMEKGRGHRRGLIDCWIYSGCEQAMGSCVGRLQLAYHYRGGVEAGGLDLGKQRRYERNLSFLTGVTSGLARLLARG